VDQLSDGTPASATLRHEFLYGPERERTREIVRAMSGTAIGAVQRTIYSADAIEKEIDAVAGTTKIRTYLPLGLGFTEEAFTGTAIAPSSIGTAVERYFHKDNLGSPVIVTDASQAVLERMAYDAWGRRRQSNGLEVGWQYLNAQSAANTLDHRGYTGQEQLDDLSLVHLNGRVYDPMTGRMTSPDPTIPDPYDLQSLNRASYVRNSPMDKVDPTGFIDATVGGKCSNGTHGCDGGAGTPTDQRKAAAEEKKKSSTEAKPNPTKLESNSGIPTKTEAKGANGPNAEKCGDACAPTGANLGTHGLPFGVTREDQQKVDEQAGKIAVEGASLILTPELSELKAAGTAAKELPALRQAYVEAVSELKSAADSLKAAGADTEALARALHAERRAIGEEFKAMTPADKLAEIYARNVQKYGDKLGPTIDWLRSKGKSWDQIIESATRTGGKDLGF
jgi:RHS repeat-associated protein